MIKWEDIIKKTAPESNVYTIKDLEKVNMDNLRGYKIDELIIDSKYKNTIQLSIFILKILPNITTDGVTTLKIYYCDNLKDFLK